MRNDEKSRSTASTDLETPLRNRPGEAWKSTRFFTKFHQGGQKSTRLIRFFIRETDDLGSWRFEFSFKKGQLHET